MDMLLLLLSQTTVWHMVITFFVSAALAALLVSIPCMLDLAHWAMVLIIAPTVGLMFAFCAAECEWKTEPRDPNL